MGSAGTSERRAMTVTVALYVGILAMKLTAFLLSGVMVLLGEALHTLSDVFIYGFLLVAAIWSAKEADQTYMFGYGRAQNVAALVAATLFISFTSYKLYEEAIPRLFRPAEAGYQHVTLALAVIVVAMVIAAAPLITLIRRRKRGAAARAQLVSLVNDELGLFAALLGTLFVRWGMPIADPIATIAVATVIAYSAVGLFRENVKLLLGRSPGAEYLETVVRAARSVDGVLDVYELRAEYVGPEVVHAGMHISVAPGTTIGEAQRIVAQVKARVHEGTGGGYCFIQVDAAAREDRMSAHRAPEAA